MSEQTDPEALRIFDALIRHAKAAALRDAAEKLTEGPQDSDCADWLRDRANQIGTS